MDTRNESKSYIVRKGFTMAELVEKMADYYRRSANVPNLFGKLRRDSLCYRDDVELADTLGYDVIWQRRGKTYIEIKIRTSKCRSDQRNNHAFIITVCGYTQICIRDPIKIGSGLCCFKSIRYFSNFSMVIGQEFVPYLPNMKKGLHSDYKSIIIVISSDRGDYMEKPKLHITAKKYTGESMIVTIRMPKDMCQELDRIAADTGRSRNELIGTCLEFALQHMEIDRPN